MRSGAKVAIVGGAFVLVAGGLSYGAYTVLTGDGDVGIGSQSAPAEVKSGPPDAKEIAAASKAFFDAWSSGNGSLASQLTNNAVDAEPVLTGYSTEAHIENPVITPGPAVGATVPYTVKATVSYEEEAGRSPTPPS